MTDNWVGDAVASQEEHIKRWESCGGVTGVSHDFQTFRGPGSKLPVPDEVTWRQCAKCDVTETRQDYAVKLLMQGKP